MIETKDAPLKAIDILTALYDNAATASYLFTELDQIRKITSALFITLESCKKGGCGINGAAAYLPSLLPLRDEVLAWLHRFVASVPLDALHLIVGMGLLEVILGHLDTEAA